LSDSHNNAESAAKDGAVTSSGNRDRISLLDLIGVLARRWRLIFFATFFAAVGIVLFSVYTLRMPSDSRYNPLPNVYEPQAQILLADPSSGSGLSSALSGSDLGILAGLAGIGGGTNNSAALAQSLLRGNWIIDRIIEEFGLLEKYAGTENTRTTARNSIRNGLTANFDSASGILVVRFKNIDREYATDVLQRIVELLEARFVSLTRENARARSEAIQAQLNQLEDDVQKARDTFSSFQRRYGVVDPEVQGSQTLQLISQFSVELFNLERQKQQLLQVVSDSNDPQVQRVQRDIDLYEQFISELETGFRVYSPVSIPRDELGQITVQYLDLQRDLQLKEEIYFTFQTEMVRAQIETQDTSRVFQVIEPPEVPEIKTSPSRGTMCMVVTLAAFFLSVFLAFVREYFARAAGDPEEARKLEMIRGQFRRRRKES